MGLGDRAGHSASYPFIRFQLQMKRLVSGWHGGVRGQSETLDCNKRLDWAFSPYFNAFVFLRLVLFNVRLTVRSNTTLVTERSFVDCILGYEGCYEGRKEWRNDDLAALHI